MLRTVLSFCDEALRERNGGGARDTSKPRFSIPAATELGTPVPEWSAGAHRQFANVEVLTGQAGAEWPILLRIVVLRLTPFKRGEAVTLPSFRLFVFPIYFPALFADACTLAGGAYFLQSGFEQRSCSIHEHATRLSPFQKSQRVSSVHPQPRQARSLVVRSSWAARIAGAVFSPRALANDNKDERSLESSRCPSTDPSKRAATRSWFS